MNTAPFSFDATFLPEEGREDKIDLQLSGWMVIGIGTDHEDVLRFKELMSSPPEGCKSLAWGTQEAPPMFGSFFCRPELHGKDRAKLKIRKEALYDDLRERVIAPPLCGGHCLFPYKPAGFLPTGTEFYAPKLNLSLNLQRFLRHQLTGSEHLGIENYSLRQTGNDRSIYGDEFSFDDNDNWLPTKFSSEAGPESLQRYLEVIEEEFENDLNRARRFLASDSTRRAGDYEFQIDWQREDQSFRLEKVETVWEFPSEDPIADVVKIGSRLVHYGKSSGRIEWAKYDISKALRRIGSTVVERVVNSACVSIPLAEGVRLKLYAKTNKRIRFEVVQSSLSKRRAGIYADAGLQPSEHESSAFVLPLLIKSLRKRAADHLNRVMDEVRKTDAKPVSSVSLINLLVEVGAAVQPVILSKQGRIEQVRNLMIWLCLFKGYRGSATKGPYAFAVSQLVKRGVLTFDPNRKFYTVADRFLPAAEALSSASGELLTSILGLEGDRYQLSPDGTNWGRVRDD